MSDEIQKQYDDALKQLKKLEFFVMEMEWKKAKTEQDTYQEAFCAGVLALCKQNQIMLEMMQAFHRHIREVHRHVKEMHEGTSKP